jgi:hypothetical protein
MLKTSNLTQSESISLSNEITHIGVTDTPIVSLLLARKKVEKANGPIHTWREKTLDTTADVSVTEGNKNIQMYQSGRAELSNACEIFQKGVSVSGTAQAMSIKGQGNLFASEIADRLLEIKVNWERAVTSGTKNTGESSPYVRKMQGLENWVDSSHIVNAEEEGKVTEDEIKQTVKILWDEGLPTGEYFALVNADMKEQIDALFKDSYRYVAQQNVFGLVVDVLRTNYGNVNFILSRHATPNKMTVFDVNYLALANLRGPHFQPLAKTGDAVEGMVLLEGTLKVGSKKAIAQYVI